MRINNYILLGALFILLSVLIFFSDFLDVFIRPFTQIFLMGSSKGKDILFFGIFGLLLILSQIFEYNFSDKLKYENISKKNNTISKIRKSKIFSIFKWKNSTFLKISIILFFIISILGLVLELVMRYYLGIGSFTIFVAMVPDATTTSLLHSHIYKSVIGSIVTSDISNVPLGIHTGDSLYQYIPFLANIIIIALPILFLTLLGSLKNRLTPSSLILTFAASCGLIGIFDGGLFSTPAIIGIYGMLFVYFDEDGINYYLGKIFKNKSPINKSKNRISIVKTYGIKSYKTFKRLLPHIILILIILFRIYISILGTDTEYYEVNIMNPDTALNDINSINNGNISIISAKDNTNNLILAIIPNYNEMQLLNNLTKSLNNKCSSYSMTWNFYSYFENNNK